MIKFFSHWQTEIDIEEEIEFLTNQEDVKKLILHNDDFNTFDWVIQSLVEICKHSFEQAEQCANIVHFNGKCQVKHGPRNKMSSLHRLLIQRGLTATIE